MAAAAPAPAPAPPKTYPTIRETPCDGLIILERLAKHDVSNLFCVYRKFESAVRIVPIPGYTLCNNKVGSIGLFLREKDGFECVELSFSDKNHNLFSHAEKFFRMSSLDPDAPCDAELDDKCWEELGDYLCTLLNPYVHFDRIRELVVASPAHRSQHAEFGAVMEIAEALENLVRVSAKHQLDRKALFALLV